MTEAEASHAIRSYFETEWAARTSLVFDNTTSEPPEQEAWARISVRHNEAPQMTQGAPGNNRYEPFGRVFIQIFTPQGTNPVEAEQLASAAAAIFRGKSLSDDIRFLSPSVKEIGNDPHGWFQINVDVRFRHSIYA